MIYLPGKTQQQKQIGKCPPVSKAEQRPDLHRKIPSIKKKVRKEKEGMREGGSE